MLAFFAPRRVEGTPTEAAVRRKNGVQVPQAGRVQIPGPPAATKSAFPSWRSRCLLHSAHNQPPRPLLPITPPAWQAWPSHSPRARGQSTLASRRRSPLNLRPVEGAPGSKLSIPLLRLCFHPSSLPSVLSSIQSLVRVLPFPSTATLLLRPFAGLGSTRLDLFRPIVQCEILFFLLACLCSGSVPTSLSSACRLAGITYRTSSKVEAAARRIPFVACPPCSTRRQIRTGTSLLTPDSAARGTSLTVCVVYCTSAGAGQEKEREGTKLHHFVLTTRVTHILAASEIPRVLPKSSASTAGTCTHRSTPSRSVSTSTLIDQSHTVVAVVAAGQLTWPLTPIRLAPAAHLKTGRLKPQKARRRPPARHQPALLDLSLLQSNRRVPPRHDQSDRALSRATAATAYQLLATTSQIRPRLALCI